MSNRDASRALRNTRVLRATKAPVAEFESDRGSRSFVRPIVTGLLSGALGLGVAVGVITTASASASVQDQSSSMVDTTTPDKSSAKPIDKSKSAEQQAVEAEVDTPTGQDDGALQAFQQRGTTVNRNSVRAQLSAELNSTSNSDRSVNLGETNATVTAAQAAAQQKKLQAEMDSDVAKVKKEAARIKEEKRKAAELLKQQQEAAKLSGIALPDGPVDLSTLTTSGGGALPLKPGTFRLGAGWGATGSWARYHTGQDFGAACGTPVYAAAAGVVGSSVGGWAGNDLVLHHANGGSTLYAHLSRHAVSQGSVVKAGQLIGYVGNTGRSFGCHLHFEYYSPGTTPGDVYSTGNPLNFLRAMGIAI
ncbi:M23 family metallopeptidase [Aestuariimicrobium soli]|uniref:M23 family metallopeptidase n=1 Tax=Aestuariimicrobium soli TaxID=2035834 RepID=UPI003EBEE309